MNCNAYYFFFPLRDRRNRIFALKKNTTLFTECVRFKYSVAEKISRNEPNINCVCVSFFRQFAHLILTRRLNWAMAVCSSVSNFFLSRDGYWCAWVWVIRSKKKGNHLSSRNDSHNSFGFLCSTEQGRIVSANTNIRMPIGIEFCGLSDYSHSPKFGLTPESRYRADRSIQTH